jgi:hypothetical protein
MKATAILGNSQGSRKIMSLGRCNHDDIPPSVTLVSRMRIGRPDGASITSSQWSPQTRSRPVPDGEKEFFWFARAWYQQLIERFLVYVQYTNHNANTRLSSQCNSHPNSLPQRHTPVVTVSFASPETMYPLPLPDDNRSFPARASLDLIWVL